ncbi:reverse transcriptase domain-containing protein [Tanacetum coccineum]
MGVLQIGIRAHGYREQGSCQQNATDNELPQAPIAPPTILPPSPVLSLLPIFDSRHFFPPEKISPSKDAETPVESLIRSGYHQKDRKPSQNDKTEHGMEKTVQNQGQKIPLPKDTKTPVESPIPISPSSYVGSSSPIRSTTPPPDYPFNESIFAELDNSLWIILRPLGSEPVPGESNEMPPKRTSTSEAPAMTQAAIKKLVANSVAAALEAKLQQWQVLVIPTGIPDLLELLRSSSWPHLLGLNEPNQYSLHSKYAKENKVTFATGTLTDDALSWLNAYAQPIGIDQANKITWIELKRLLTNKYCPRTEVRKMEDEFYNLTVKGNDLKTYIRRF